MWGVPNDGGSSIINYQIRYKQKGETNWSESKTTFDPSYKFPGLVTAKDYDFEVKACTSVQCSDCSFTSFTVTYTVETPKEP